jgi:multiple sugar transport system ATP-binding protein
MDRGIVQQVDTPMTIYQRPANRFVGSFIGSPAMNLFAGAIDGREFRLADGGLIPLDAANAALRAGPATLGVRPEDLLPDGQGLPLATVELDVVEQMGHETMVHFALAGSDHIARLAPEFRVAPGERLALAIRPGAFHLFDNDAIGARLN